MENASLSFLRGLLSRQDKKYSTQDIEMVRKLLGDNSISDYYIMGIFLRHSEEAERVLRRMIEEDPHDLSTIYMLANLLNKIGRYHDAEELYQKMIEEADDTISRIDYSHFLEEQGRYMEAEKQVREALRLDPENLGIWAEYGGLLESWGKWGKAKKAYKTALTQIPSGDEFRKTLKQKIKDRDSVDLWRDEFTVGTMYRFQLFFGPEVPGFLETKLDEGFLKQAIESFPEKPYLEKANETGDYLGAILEVEKDKSKMKVSDPEEWAYGEELWLLFTWKPAFDLMLVQTFYEEKCGECQRNPRIEMGCQKGLCNCPYDAEFEEHIRASIRSVVNKLQQGVDPRDIPMLEIPELTKIIEDYDKILHEVEA
jgi:tetratricopeptide (TPR) repeat protein